MKTRKLELTHQEIDLVQRALNKIYSDHLKLIGTGRLILDEANIKAIITNADRFGKLREKINAGLKDV